MPKFDSAALENLTRQFHQLPGIGRKTAERLALYIFKTSEQEAKELAEAVVRVKTEIRTCERCYNITEKELCPICENTQRDAGTICVVEDVVDILAIEKSNEYRGVYHVLGGVISPLAGVSPDDLHIQSLLNRVANEPVKEVLLAINPSTEGEATMIYLSQLLKKNNVKVTKIASGIPLGAHLEFIDDATIGRAIQSRSEI